MTTHTYTYISTILLSNESHPMSFSCTNSWFRLSL